MGLLAVPSDSQLGCNCSTPLKIGLCVAEILERVEGWHPRCLIQLEQSFAESKQILCQKLLSFTATKIPSHSQNCRKHRFCEQSRRHRVLFRCVLMTPRLPAIRQCLLPPPRQEAENVNFLSTALEECVYKEHFETIKESLHTADLPCTVFLLLDTFSMRAGGKCGLASAERLPGRCLQPLLLSWEDPVGCSPSGSTQSCVRGTPGFFWDVLSLVGMWLQALICWPRKRVSAVIPPDSQA